MAIGPTPLGITRWDDRREDLGGPLVDSANATQQAPAGEPAPGALAAPGRTVEGLLTLALPRRQGAHGEAGARGLTGPPASAGQGKAPEDRCVGLAQEELAPTGLVLTHRQGDSGVGEGRRGGRQQSGGPRAAHRRFFTTRRTRSRPSWTPVARAKPGASARPLQCEEREPCSRGAASTRRLRGCSSAQVIWGGRPERGRPRKPWGPSCAKRCTHWRRAECAQCNASETAWTW
jgi:hypothetical protein